MHFGIHKCMSLQNIGLPTDSKSILIWMIMTHGFLLLPELFVVKWKIIFLNAVDLYSFLSYTLYMCSLNSPQVTWAILSSLCCSTEQHSEDIYSIILEKNFLYVTSQTQGYFQVNFLKPVDLQIVNLEYEIRYNMRPKLCSGNLLHFLIKLKNNLLTANWWQVGFSVDSCISDMDHRETVVFMLEHLEHLIRFQDLIQMSCQLSFHKIKEK